MIIFDRNPLIKVKTLNEFNQLSASDQIRIVGSNPRLTTYSQRSISKWGVCSLHTEAILHKIPGVYSWGISGRGKVSVHMNIMTNNEYWKEFDLSDTNTRTHVVKCHIAQQLINACVIKTIDELDIYFNLEITFDLKIQHYID
jgi:hypothetical protein